MSERKKIAAVITTWFYRSHADVLLGKFMQGFPADDGLHEPRVDVASVYMDQKHEKDECIPLCEELGIPMFDSIKAALCCGGKELAVDGVLIIGEHGDYPWNEKKQHLYPRKYFFEQVCGVFAESGRSVPVFCDKHLSYNWADAKWMAGRAADLGVPFMAGSSIPYSWRKPWIEYEQGTEFEEILGIGFGGIESYGFHTLEGMQCMAERRKGGETGVKAVQTLQGEAVWQAAKDGLWSPELVEASHTEKDDLGGHEMQEAATGPVLFLVEYADGVPAGSVMLIGYTAKFGFGARVGGEAHALCYNLPSGEPWPHFSYLGLNIEEMFLTGRPAVSFERTLLVTGILEAAMDSLYRGGERIETPHLEFGYESYENIPFLPKKEAAEGASLPLEPAQ